IGGPFVPFGVGKSPRTRKTGQNLASCHSPTIVSRSVCRGLPRSARFDLDAGPFFIAARNARNPQFVRENSTCLGKRWLEQRSLREDLSRPDQRVGRLPRTDASRRWGDRFG